MRSIKRRFREQGHALIQRHPDWFPAVEYAPELIGGIGGMMRLTPFGGVKEKVVAAAKALYDQGVILFWCGHGPFHLRMLPPLPALKVEQWPDIFAAIESGLAKVA